MLRWEMSKSVPDQSLRLNWVYGYRGHQCRSNLHFNCEDDVVYFIAACGIVYNPKYHKQGMIYKKIRLVEDAYNCSKIMVSFTTLLS